MNINKYIYKLMNRENYIDLTENDNQIIQPQELKIELMPHQKTIIHAMDKFERDGYITISDINGVHWTFGGYTMGTNKIKRNIKINATFGILGDKVGSGKSLMIVSLILHNQQPQKKEYVTFGSPYLYISDMSEYMEVPTNLLILPSKLRKQWRDFFKYAPTLEVYECYDVTCISKLELVNVIKYNVIIIVNTKYKEFYEKFNTIKWGRIIIDEADTIQMTRDCKYNAFFIWLVTGTPLNLRSRSRIQSILGNINNEILNKMIVSTENRYLEQSIILPTPNRITMYCDNPVELTVLGKVLPKSILGMINSGNTALAIKTINCNVDTTDNIFQVVVKKIREQITSKTMELEVLKSEPLVMQQKNEARIKRLETSINRLETNYESIKERLFKMQNEICAICMSDFDRPTLVACCNNLFCFDCIITSLTTVNERCPYCQTHITKDQLNVISEAPIEQSESEVKKEKKKTDKFSALLDLIKKKPDGKIMVFANYHDTFMQIEKMLNENNISHAVLKGHMTTVANTISNFTNGNLKVLMLNAQYFGAGMNLQVATDIVIFHRFKRELEEQIIGRAQRLGRTSALNVYYLLHEGENNTYETSFRFSDTFEFEDE